MRGELKPEQRLELVRDFVQQEIGDRHAYQFAIHNPSAAIDGGEQENERLRLAGLTRKTPDRGWSR